MPGVGVVRSTAGNAELRADRGRSRCASRGVDPLAPLGHPRTRTFPVRRFQAGCDRCEWEERLWAAWLWRPLPAERPPCSPLLLHAVCSGPSGPGPSTWRETPGTGSRAEGSCPRPNAIFAETGLIGQNVYLYCAFSIALAAWLKIASAA